MSQNYPSQPVKNVDITKETHPELYPSYNPALTSDGRIIDSPWRQMPKMPGFRYNLHPAISPVRIISIWKY